MSIKIVKYRSYIELLLEISVNFGLTVRILIYICKSDNGSGSMSLISNYRSVGSGFSRVYWKIKDISRDRRYMGNGALGTGVILSRIACNRTSPVFGTSKKNCLSWDHRHICADLPFCNLIAVLRIRCLFYPWTRIRDQDNVCSGSWIPDPKPTCFRAWVNLWVKSSITLWKLGQIFFLSISKIK